MQRSPSFDVHKWDQIKVEVERIGQEFKRQLTQHVLERADRRVAEIAQISNPAFHKHGTRPFTIVSSSPRGSAKCNFNVSDCLIRKNIHSTCRKIIHRLKRPWE